MFNLKKIYELIAGTSLNDAHEIPVSEGSGPGLTKRYSIGQLKAFLWAYIQLQISGITKGDTGPQGATGAQGIQGQQGEKGLKGDKGDQGLKGDTGAQGSQGIQGPKGDKGDKGDTGSQGLQGIQGDKGDKGEQGDQGTDGAIIVAGEAANILSGNVNPTTEGVDGDFYINLGAKLLFGPKSGGTWPEIGIILTGEQGPQGIQGIAGPQGNQGLQGIQGIKGDTGATGPKGDKGDAGSQGVQGVKGDKGDQGLPGTNGLNGENGTNGTNGVGVPIGGTSGQVLAKIDNTNHNTHWIDPTSNNTKGRFEIGYACSDEVSNLTAGVAKIRDKSPYDFRVVGLQANVNVASTGSSIIINIKKNGTSIFSTNLSIDANETTSLTAAVPYVLAVPNTDFSIGDNLQIDLEQVGIISAGVGLKVKLLGYIL